MCLHAKIKALQNTTGISYKDAAHHLYMVEVSKLNTEEEAKLSMSGIWVNIDKTIVNDIYSPLVKLDSVELDSGEGYNTR